MFAISKILGWVLEPGSLFLALLVLGCVLLVRGRLRWGRRLVLAAMVLAGVPAVLPVWQWLSHPLEERFQRPDKLPDHIDGFVVLGGALDPWMSGLRGGFALGSSAERLTAVVPLARAHPEAVVLFTSGSASLVNPDLKEGPVGRDFLVSLGVDPARIIVEDQSRNTWENALFSRALAKPSREQTWVLITSAMHMPRSVGCFRMVGWRVIPWPVDYHTQPGGAGLRLRYSGLGGMGAAAAAMHEWQGLVYYHLRGWTDALFPAPG